MDDFIPSHPDALCLILGVSNMFFYRLYSPDFHFGVAEFFDSTLLIIVDSETVIK